jgi:hypothetical protein
VCVEVPSRRASESNLPDPTNVRDAPQPAPKPASHKHSIWHRKLNRDQRCRATSKDEYSRVHGRSRCKEHSREPASNTALVEGTPNHIIERARRRKATLHRYTPFNDEIGGDQLRPRIVEQEMKHVRRTVERKIRDDPERLRRELHVYSVCLDDIDVRPPSAKPRGPCRIKLNRNNATNGPRQLGSQPAAPGTEIEHKIIRTNTRVSDELRRERV